MQYPRSFPRIMLARCVVVVAALSLNAHSAEWRDCEKAKLRELQLQRHTSSYKTTRRKSRHHDEDRLQREEELDTWLWKNCREFSYELRKLEQERM